MQKGVAECKMVAVAVACGVFRSPLKIHSIFLLLLSPLNF
jgi:hypothetical protein